MVISRKMINLILVLLALLCILTVGYCNDQKLNPNEIAPNFTLSTLSGPIIYKGINNKETTLKGPIIFHSFSSYSGFLEALWKKNESLLDLIDNSPENTNYVFLNSEHNPHECAMWMEKRFDEILDKYFQCAESLKCDEKSDKPGDRRSFKNNVETARKRHRYFPKPHRRIERRSLNFSDVGHDDLLKTLKRKPKILRRHHVTKKWNAKNYIKRNNIEHYHNAHGIFNSFMNNTTFVKEFHDDNQVLKRSLVANMYENLSEDENSPNSIPNNCGDDALQKRVSEILSGGKEQFKNEWKSRLHFVNVSVQELGNFIPLVLSRWHCSGHGCGLDQVAVETAVPGEVHLVSKRLDGRYDWLTSPYTIKATKPRPQVIDIGDGCSVKPWTKYTNKTVLISNDGNCKYFDKLKNAQQHDALCAIIYTEKGESLFDMVCQGKECEAEMKIPGTMIPYEEGMKMVELIKTRKEVFVKFQHTPWWNFFLAIDEQGKLQEVGWLVYPSMIFLSYQAKWLNYVTNLLHNITSLEDAHSFEVFPPKKMQGEKGVVVTKTLDIDVKKDIPRYEHVYLDMALGCPGSTDFNCPHWDHTVQLYLNCGDDKSKREIGRWITPFRRRIGRWLTDIQPLVPLFSAQKCKFTMKTVPWAMEWRPSLKIRFSSKKKGPIDAPSEVIDLFRGGKFDKTYNEDKPDRKRNKTIHIPKDVTRIKLFAVITGHGSDSNNCAEFCVTSHHFKINGNDYDRIFDNAGSATGCADRVSEGSEPNEHGTWLYGRNGWCDGEKVGPWIEDVTKQINVGKETTLNIQYYGYFNGADPNPDPKREIGNIIMYSYLVLYRKMT